MRTAIKCRTPLVFWCVIVLLSTACGGGGDTTIGGQIGESSGNPPALVGEITQQLTAADMPVPAASTGIEYVEAPLGVSSEYDSAPAAATLVSHQTSRTASTLEPFELFKVNWVTVTLADGVPDPDNPDLVFNEGDLVDLWAEYEIAADVNHSRFWNLPEAG